MKIIEQGKKQTTQTVQTKSQRKEDSPIGLEISGKQKLLLVFVVIILIHIGALLWIILKLLG